MFNPVITLIIIAKWNKKYLSLTTGSYLKPPYFSEKLPSRQASLSRLFRVWPFLCFSGRSNAFPAKCESFLNLLCNHSIDAWFHLRWAWQIQQSRRLLSVWHFASPRRSTPILHNVSRVLNILFDQGIEVWFYCRGACHNHLQAGCWGFNTLPQ